jgi:uncharacterized protein (DUF608 family)
MGRDCNCSGRCCGGQDDGVNRRDFISLVGAGAATAALAGPAWADWVQQQVPAEELARWKKSLREPSLPRVYRSGVHGDARMHLGGIGTGNIEIGCDGQCTNWQLFNTLHDGYVPLMFAVKAGTTVRLLQTAGGPDWPRVKRIEMIGEYPIAALRYLDAELPVRVELSAFTPFAPLDTRFSSQPLVVLVFRVQNPATEYQMVSLAALMQNPVGYDALGPIKGMAYGKFGGNVNEPFREGAATGLLMRADPGQAASLDKAVHVYAGINLQNLQHSLYERPNSLALTVVGDDAFENIKLSDPAHSVLWLEQPARALSERSLRAVRNAVRNGATMIFSGKQPNDPLPQLFENQPLPPADKRMLLSGEVEVVVRPLGQGQVAVAAGSVLDPAQTPSATARQRAYAVLCELVGAHFTPVRGVPPSACGFGTVALAALGRGVTVLPAIDRWDTAWEQFKAAGGLLPAEQATTGRPTAAGQTIGGAVAAEVSVPPGGSVEVPFLLAWHFPNNYNKQGLAMGCHYATLWPDAKAVVREAAANLPTIRRRTEAFRTTFYQSTLPYWMLDCLTSQAATIRHIGVVFRIAGGDVYGWEGSNGCCTPTCTHVWGYEQSMARLFPDLEKDMRRIDFMHQQRADGGVNNRTDVPSPKHPTGEHPFTDGHASCVLKAYREAMNHPDDSFFKAYWPHVRRAVEYLVNRDAAGAGGLPDGTLKDDQFNTYDQALHGVTTFISAYYLAALRAGQEWARRMGDMQTADRFHTIFLRGQENLVKRCWNGEYFQQDLPDYRTRSVELWPGARGGEIGPGCMADQLIGQWWAHQLGLGYLLPKHMVQRALRSIFKYNWLAAFAGFKQMPRAFAGPRDKGLLVCTWPKGGRPPVVMLYSDEVWTGMEYHVAAHMLYEGMIEEALSIVRGARDRYDGVPRPPITRNPWNELECGGHYARAMSSWSLLLAASGYEYDGPAKSLRFTPRLTPANFQSFFSGPEGWGSLRQMQGEGGQRNEIRVVEGRFAVARVFLAPSRRAHEVKASLDGTSLMTTLAPAFDGVQVTLASPVVIKSGGTLSITLS